jgi:S-adenosylmethionine decarboxylase
MHKLLPIPPHAKRLGRHLIVDAWKAPADVLNDPEQVREALARAVAAGGATLIDICVHQFSPYGVTATATLAESHIAIHTWPEYGYFAADVFFCGETDPRPAVDSLVSSMGAREARVQELDRGVEIRRLGEARFLAQITSA